MLEWQQYTVLGNIQDDSVYGAKSFF